jgi:hypothetical protein
VATNSEAPTTHTAPPSEGRSPAPPGGSGVTAQAALAHLPIKGRAPKTGYSRELFGPAWADTNRNGCDTRNDILGRDLTAVVLKPGTNGCVVLSGELRDPYTGHTIDFERGPATSIDVQIDHVVALSDAWQKGAQSWDILKRMAFANDPLNLHAVDGPANAAKGDGDAATWLPVKPARCAYVARQIAVKAKYRLWVTPAEAAAMTRVLASCPDEPLPSSRAPTSAPINPPGGSQTTSGNPTSSGRTAVTYANCTAARAAGVTPIHRGDPGYSGRLDRDGDGVACE